MESKTYTKGNVIVENIKVGDIHYEFEHNLGIKCEVITLPKKEKDENWYWESKNLTTGEIISYVVNPKYPHYGPNLYDHEAYRVKKYI